MYTSIYVNIYTPSVFACDQKLWQIFFDECHWSHIRIIYPDFFDSQGKFIALV